MHFRARYHYSETFVIKLKSAKPMRRFHRLRY